MQSRTFSSKPIRSKIACFFNMPWAHSSSTDALISFRCHSLCICARTERFVNIITSFQCGQKGTITKWAAITGILTCQNAWRMCLSCQWVNRPCFEYTGAVFAPRDIIYYWIVPQRLNGYRLYLVSKYNFFDQFSNMTVLLWETQCKLLWMHYHFLPMHRETTSIDPLRMKFMEIFSSSLISQPMLANQLMKYR